MLEGYTILDLSRLFPGPYCTMVLADLGAEVIKIEEPGKGDHMRAYPPYYGTEGALYTQINRNKKSVALDLRREKGRGVFYRLVSGADVVVESFRPDVKHRLRISYEDLKELNQDIIYCSVSGFGQDGPYRDLPGHDLTYIGLAGLAGLYRQEGEAPGILPVPIADMGGGALVALSGILAALLAREKTGRGTFVDVAMFDGLFPWLLEPLAALLAGGRNQATSPPSIFSGRMACYNLYPTADGRYLAVAAVENEFWENLCRLAGREDYLPHQFTPEKQPEMRAFFTEFFRRKPLTNWFEELRAWDICCGPVNSLEEAVSDPQAVYRGLVVETEHPRLGQLKQLRMPLRFSTYEPSVRLAAPQLGEHTQQILAAAGYGAEEIEAMAREGCIQLER